MLSIKYISVWMIVFKLCTVVKISIGKISEQVLNITGKLKISRFKKHTQIGKIFV